MFKKKKSNELDFYYLSKDNKDKRVQKKKHPKKKMKKKNPEPINDNMFNIDNEIVIGVTVLPDKKKENQKNKRIKNKKGQAKKKGKNSKNKNNRKQTNFDIYDDRINNSYNRKNTNKKKRKQYKKISPEEERKRRIRKEKRLKIIKAILKIILFIAIIAGVTAFLLVSPVFNINEISVSGNNKIQATEIESLSQLNIEQNIFRFSKENVKNNIKQNAYIDSVEIKRKLPNKIEISVTERTPAYQIKFGNAFAYIDEKGNILEINEEDLKLPLINGYKTKIENLKAGNVLQEDITKLDTVNSIIRVSKSNEIYDMITSIDITNDEEYKVEFKEEGKTAHLGDASNINDRILLLKEILLKEKDNKGEIFINDLNKVFFREKV